MPTKSGLPTKREQKRLITILKEDFDFDVVSEMVAFYHKVKNSRLPIAKKYPLVFQILAKIWDHSVSKVRPEELDNYSGDNIQFNIVVGGTAPEQVPANQKITIPTKKGMDGSFIVDFDRQTPKP